MLLFLTNIYQLFLKKFLCFSEYKRVRGMCHVYRFLNQRIVITFCIKSINFYNSKTFLLLHFSQKNYMYLKYNINESAKIISKVLNLKDNAFFLFFTNKTL